MTFMNLKLWPNRHIIIKKKLSNVMCHLFYALSFQQKNHPIAQTTLIILKTIQISIRGTKNKIFAYGRHQLSRRVRIVAPIL